MAKIRQEINIICKSRTQGDATPDNARILIDTTQYSATATYYFEAVGSCTSSNATVVLERATGGTDDASVTFTAGAAISRLRSSSFSPPAGQTEYKMVVTGGISFSIKAARVIILQDGASITSTETAIEIGNQETGKVNTTLAALTQPKYWLYTAANWDGTKTFYAECTYMQTGSGVVTIKLQEDDGSFGSWADKVTIVNAATPSTYTLTRSAAFTPTDGRNYRIVGLVASNMDTWEIYNAKVIVQQNDYRDDFSSGEGVGANMQGGTATSGETQQALGQSFLTGSAYSLAAIDLKIIRVLSPTDNVYLELVSGSITGTVEGTSDDVVGSSLPTSVGTRKTRFTFSTPVSLSSGVRYYVRFLRDGARDTTNYYSWRTSGDKAAEADYDRDNNTWAATGDSVDYSLETYGNTAITKLEPQYLLANTGYFGASTGLKDFDTYYDPAEWSEVTNTYTHEANNSAAGTMDTKLQSDPNGSPADVTNSTITDVIEREESSAMTMPGAAATIDENVTGSQVNAGHASRILVAVVITVVSGIPNKIYKYMQAAKRASTY